MAKMEAARKKNLNKQKIQAISYDSETNITMKNYNNAIEMLSEIKSDGFCKELLRRTIGAEQKKKNKEKNAFQNTNPLPCRSGFCVGSIFLYPFILTFSLFTFLF